MRQRVRLGTMKTCRLSAGAALVLAAVGISDLPASAQTFQELHAFGGLDGIDPEGALIQATDGNFYGTTTGGGLWGAGTAFKISPIGQFTTLANFDGTNTGVYPCGALLQASDGNFYGTTLYGAPGAQGSLFKMTPDGTLTTLVWFGYGASQPLGDLAQGSDGNIYGTTEDPGSVFRMVPSCDSWQLQTLCAPYYQLSGPVIQATDGNFYGLSPIGGADYGAAGYGFAYKMTPDGSFTNLAIFYRGQWPNLQATYPTGKLIQTSDGNFYGAAEGGNDGASVFKMTPDGALTTFGCDYDTGGAGPNGVIQANDGNFYGTMAYGGVPGSVGWVFRMTPGGVFGAVLSFTGEIGPYIGGNPYAGLIQGSDGNLYGTTGNYGSLGNGNVFRIIMPGPLLSSTQAGSQLVLSWRTNYVGFSLQSSPDASTSNWTVCTNLPVIIGGQYVITNPISATAAFFRLKK